MQWFRLQNAPPNYVVPLRIGVRPQESNDLQAFASGELIPWEVYKIICRDLRVDAHRGAGKEELIQLYARLGLKREPKSMGP